MYKKMPRRACTVGHFLGAPCGARFYGNFSSCEEKDSVSK